MVRLDTWNSGFADMPDFPAGKRLRRMVSRTTSRKQPIRHAWNKPIKGKEISMSVARLLRTCFIRAPLIPFAMLAALSAEPAGADEPLAKVIADGKPWEMFVVKRRASNILVFRPDGGGTISDGLASIHPTWRAVLGGICVRPKPGDAERCLDLARTKDGIAASQNGRTVWVLKR
ncbi:hypothetical protein [Rhizobium bangladeshense]|uniref:hypothetical protein n=1 Tax=Rhizobium bangladeshense TaxID=1138189 RepID=UPI001FD897BC|nr:hypothetical protein [Rhizobium bangladeshense]